MTPGETPPAALLLSHWREVTAKGQDQLVWGEDRAAAILAHIDALEAQVAAERAHVEQLREVLAFNREQADRAEKAHLRAMAELRKNLAESS